MDKVKELLKNKNLLIIILGVVVVVVVAVIIVVSTKAEETNQVALENLLKEMGKDFYENYYYDYTGKTEKERSTFLAKYSSIGIKINLDNLSRYNSKVNEEKIKEFVNSETNEECNKETTTLIIYPKADYDKTDYDMKVELDCGLFEKETKKK